MKEVSREMFELTDVEVKNVLESDGYKDWLMDLMMSGDWKEFCKESLCQRGKEPSGDLATYAYVYFRCDNRGTQKAWEREFEFSLWLIGHYSDSPDAFACVALPFIEEHDHKTITSIMERVFKNSIAYDQVVRLISRYDEQTKDRGGRNKPSKKGSYTTDNFKNDIAAIQNDLKKEGICEKDDEGNICFLDGIASYAWLIYQLTLKYWGEKDRLRIAEIDCYFKHKKFLSTGISPKWSDIKNEVIPDTAIKHKKEIKAIVLKHR